MHITFDDEALSGREYFDNRRDIAIFSYIMLTCPGIAIRSMNYPAGPQPAA
jgi:hypothetical protein